MNMNKQQFILNAIDANGFVSSDTAAGYINPTLWNKELLRFVEARLVFSRVAKVYTDILGAPGASFNVTIGAAPSAAAAVSETDDISISTYSKTQVTFTPSEYGAAYNLSDKEARRAFFDVANDMVNHLAYSLALKRDTTARDIMTTAAGNSVVANSVASSAIASSDTLDYEDIVNAVAAIRVDKLFATELFVSVGQFAQLAKLDEFKLVNQSGTSETLRTGQIGTIYGLTVYETDLIAPSGSKSKAVVHGRDALGVPSIGIGLKAMPSIRTERHELGRYTDIVAVEEWDMKVLRANGLCTIESYDNVSA